MIETSLLSSAGVQVADTAAVPQKGKVLRHSGARHKSTDELPVGFSADNMDPSVAPGQDFYRYAAGGWLDRAVIDDTRSEISPVSILSHLVNDQVLDLLRSSAKQSPTARKGSLEQLVGDHFAAAMDTERLDALGISPLQPELDRIAAITTPVGLAAEVGRLALQFNTVALIIPFVGPDRKQNDVNILMVLSNIGGLGSRDMYLTDTYAALREAYQAHVRRMLTMAGLPEEAAEAEARTVLSLETALAQATMSDVEKANPDATYNKIPAAEMKALLPHFDVDALFDEMGLTAEGDVIVMDPGYLKALDALLVERPLEDFKTLLRWQLINSCAPYLGPAFDEAELDFYAKTMKGVKTLLPREQRIASQLAASLGHPIGQLYVQEHFTQETEAQVSEMVARVRAQFEKRLRTNPWLDDATRAAALDKLSKLGIFIGHPTKWIDYSSVDIRRDDYLGNVMRLNEFSLRRVLDQAGKPVVVDEFAVAGATLPTDVNAAYQPGLNKIEISAAILQPPFFDPSLDLAANDGTLGAVIGHELTHGFDSGGRMFDAAGNLRNWWTDGDSEEFTELAGKLAVQYEQVEVLPGLHVNGQLTIKEDVADLGGLTLAYHALQEVLAEQAGPETIDGLTPYQRFFIAWAQLWMTKSRPEYLSYLIVADTHPPSQARAAGSSVNMQEFHDAFGIRPGDPMWRDEADRVVIW